MEPRGQAFCVTVPLVTAFCSWHRDSYRFFVQISSESAKKNGITKEEIAEILTHAAFMRDGRKYGAAFRMAKEVWSEKTDDSAMTKHAASMVFPIGAANDGFAQYFSGKSYLAPVSKEQVGIFNVTFEPGCRNNWHIHHAKPAAGKFLSALPDTAFIRGGWEAVELPPGDTVNIPTGVKHWHGSTGQLVLPSRRRGAGRGSVQRVAGSRKRYMIISEQLRTRSAMK